jgi:hypothetical protein
MNDRGRRMDEKIKIFISKNVFERIQKLAADQNFNSADEYVEFILNEFIADEKNDDCSEISEPDEIQIKNRLRSLGYLE